MSDPSFFLTENICGTFCVVLPGIVNSHYSHLRNHSIFNSFLPTYFFRDMLKVENFVLLLFLFGVTCYSLAFGSLDKIKCFY